MCSDSFIYRSLSEDVVTQATRIQHWNRGRESVLELPQELHKLTKLKIETDSFPLCLGFVGVAGVTSS